MRFLSLAVITLAALLPATARADEWSKTYTIEHSPQLRVETSDANILVETWDQNKIEARVTTERWKIGDSGARIVEHQSGDAVDLEVRLPHRTFVVDIGRRSVTVEIRMPRTGKVNLHTGDGRINLRGFKGDMELSSGDGRLEVDEVDGALRAHTGDGSIRAAGRFDELDVKSGDGHVELRAGTGSRVQHGWEVRTSDGSIRLDVPSDLAADVDLHTGDGSITVNVPVTVEGRVSPQNIHGKLNGGGNRLVVHTGDGSITVDKS